MHANLIETLGMERYLKLDAKIPMHIREEYVVHRLLNKGGRSVDAEEIVKEINYINDSYRPVGNIKSPLTKEYLKDKWTLEGELKKIGITF
jgi:hypothetical protein